VIRPEQLVQALDRIHPRDRELLSLSLRRRVPDEALARLYDCEPTEVARRRAGAIERLADEMELQRGEDLGAVLKALLEPATWSAAATTAGEEFAVEAGGGRLTPVPPPDDAEIKVTGPALAPVPAPVEADEEEAGAESEAAAPEPAATPTQPEPAEPQSAEAAPAEPQSAQAVPAEPESAQAAPADASGQPEPAATPSQPAPAEPAAASPTRSAQPGPVTDVVAAREREAPDPPRRAVPLALFGLGMAALIGAAGLVGATQFGDVDRIIQSDGGDGGDTTVHFVPDGGGPLATPFPSDPRTISCYSTAYVPRRTVLYREPGGRKRLRLTPRTEWGSPRVLGVVEQRGGWLGVQAPELRNGEIAWTRRRRARLDCVTWSLHADLSKRTLFVRRDGRTVRRFKIAIGRPENPTPKGRFSVTDKLRVKDPDSPYGCCVLALSGHQSHLPAYWPGGDRLAVHATSDESSIGQPVSLGCMRAEARKARWLIETIPLGAPMFVRA
jgi:L,D-transpeptidase catalytic domain